MEIFNSNDCFCRWIHLQKSTNIHRDLLGSVFCMSVEHLPRLFKESGMIFNNSANGNVKIWEGCPTIHQIHCSQAAIHSDWWKRVVEQDSRYKIQNLHTRNTNSRLQLSRHWAQQANQSPTDFQLKAAWCAIAGFQKIWFSNANEYYTVKFPCVLINLSWHLA